MVAIHDTEKKLNIIIIIRFKNKMTLLNKTHLGLSFHTHL